MSKFLFFLKDLVTSPFKDSWHTLKKFYFSFLKFLDNFNKPSFTLNILSYMFVIFSAYGIWKKNYYLAVVAFIFFLIGYVYYIYERGYWRREG